MNAVVAPQVLAQADAATRALQVRAIRLQAEGILSFELVDPDGAELPPVDAGALMGTGLFIAAVSGLAPLAFGGAVLQSAVIDIHLPVLGDLHLVTSVFFDVGVYVLVVGLVLDLLRSLGAGIDRHAAADEHDDDAELEVTS